MTIDELFNMPIREMADWLTDHFKEKEPKIVSGFCYFDFELSFGIEFPEDSNWRSIPVMSTYINKGSDRHNSMLDAMRYFNDNLYVGVAKKSKYGEVLCYVLNFELNRGTNKVYLKGIGMNSDSGVYPCLCYLAGPDLVNNSELTIHYRINDPNYKNENWYLKFPHIDNNTAVPCPVLPTVNGINRNKHPLNEIVQKVEEFAKRVQEIGVQFHRDFYETLMNSDDFKRTAKSLRIKPNELYDLFLALNVIDSRVSMADVVGIIKIAGLEEEIFADYRKKCKCKFILDYDGWPKIMTERWISMYHFCNLFDRLPHVDICNFAGYLKNLDKTREIYGQIGDYKERLKKAREDYRLRFIEMAEFWEQTIMDQIYTKIASDLAKAQDAYLQVCKLNLDEIHNLYPGITDSDIGIHEDIADIVKPIVDAFYSVGAKVMRQQKPSYSIKTKGKKKKEKKELFSDAFKAHCKQMFDAVPDLERISYAACHKCYDAPYELRDYNEETLITDDQIYTYEEQYGQGSFEEWVEDFWRLAPESYPSDYCDELYPGETYYETITRKLQPDGEKEYIG